MAHKPYLWLSEFGMKYHPGATVLRLLVDDAVTDESWHNDLCPHFEADAGEGWNVEIWFHERHPEDRNDVGDGVTPDTKRYLVCLSNRDDQGMVLPEGVQTYTEDPVEAVAAFRRLMKKS